MDILRGFLRRLICEEDLAVVEGFDVFFVAFQRNFPDFFGVK